MCALLSKDCLLQTNYEYEEHSYTLAYAPAVMLTDANPNILYTQNPKIIHKLVLTGGKWPYILANTRGNWNTHATVSCMLVHALEMWGFHRV